MKSLLICGLLFLSSAAHAKSYHCNIAEIKNGNPSNWRNGEFNYVDTLEISTQDNQFTAKIVRQNEDSEPNGVWLRLEYGQVSTVAFFEEPVTNPFLNLNISNRVVQVQCTPAQ